MSCKHGNHVDDCELCDVENELWRKIGLLRDENDALRAALAKREAVAEGFVMVPVEPTDEMIDAGCDAADAYRIDMCKAWDAMLAASQKAAKGEG
jgi:hypothetical protein